MTLAAAAVNAVSPEVGELGVSLVRIVGFSENGNYPMYYAKAEMSMAADGRGGAPVPAPEIPVGENKIISNVSVTYEIK